MPILGITASQVPGRLNTNSYESIATALVPSGGQSSVVFSSIPNTYKHLQLRYVARTTVANVNDGYINMQFNGDTTLNYYLLHYLQGEGSGTPAAGAVGVNYVIYAGVAAGNNSSANVFGGGVVEIMDYTNANKTKVTKAISGMDNNGSGKASVASGMWLSTAAITQITIGGNGTLMQNSRFALYGIKG
jgi:hypothetical protein